MKCARCGTTLIGKTSQMKRNEKTYHSYNYYCPNRRIGTCNLPGISQNLFEQKFIHLMEQWDFHQEANELIRNEAAATVEDHTEARKEIKQELKEIEKRRSKWQYAWVNEMISDIDFKKRTNEENEKEKLLWKELKAYAPIEILPQNTNIAEWWTDLKLNWSHMDNQIKKQFILIAVQSMVVDKINKDKSPDSIEIKDVRFN
jgi:site-specific DNA recombinase